MGKAQCDLIGWHWKRITERLLKRARKLRSAVNGAVYTQWCYSVCAGKEGYQSPIFQGPSIIGPSLSTRERRRTFCHEGREKRKRWGREGEIICFPPSFSHTEWKEKKNANTTRNVGASMVGGICSCGGTAFLESFADQRWLLIENWPENKCPPAPTKGRKDNQCLAELVRQREGGGSDL